MRHGFTEAVFGVFDIDRIRAAGGPPDTPPMALAIDPIGPVTPLAVRMPDGAIPEFYEPSR